MRDRTRAFGILALLAGPLLFPPVPHARAATPIRATRGGATSALRLTPQGVVTQLAVNPARDQVIYAGTDSSGIYRSETAGATWIAASAGLPQAAIAGLAIDPSHTATLYVATAAGVYKTINGGKSWASEGPPTASPSTSLALDPTAPATLYAGTGGDGIYRSTNAGATWSAIGPRLSDVRVVATDPLSPTLLFAGTNDGLLIGGVNGGWHRAGLGHVEVRAIGIGANDDRTIYAGTPNGALISRDGGASWARIGFRDRAITTIYVDPRDARRAYVASADGGGLFLTTNAGRGWLPLVAGLSGGAKVSALAIDPRDPAVTYAGLDRGVFKSLQGGRSWASSSIYDRSVRALLQPTASGSAYFAATSGGVYASGDGGNVWTSAGLGNHQVADLLAGDGSLLAATESGIYRTGNGGHTWVRTLRTPGLALLAAPGGMELAGTDRGLFSSGDAGRSWTQLSAGTDPVNALLIRDDGAIVAGSAAGVLVSTDKGATFTRHPVSDGTVVGLLAQPDSTTGRALLLARTRSGGIYRSADGGKTWADSSISGVQATALTVGTDRRLYAATARGIYLSQSHGLSWILTDQQDPQIRPLVLQPAPGAAGTLLEGLEGQGVIVRSPATTPVSPFAPLLDGAAGRYFPQTGHFVRAPFLDWYTNNGDEGIFGPPRTEARKEGGKLVQYFRNALLVYHPELANTPQVIGLEGLGRLALTAPAATVAPFDNTTARRYFPQTLHSLSGEFLLFWRLYGGLDTFGPPISEPLTTPSGVFVQYFQNVRLEAAPGAGARYFNTRLSALGDSLLKQKGWLR